MKITKRSFIKKARDPQLWATLSAKVYITKEDIEFDYSKELDEIKSLDLPIEDKVEKLKSLIVGLAYDKLEDISDLSVKVSNILSLEFDPAYYGTLYDWLEEEE